MWEVLLILFSSLLNYFNLSNKHGLVIIILCSVHVLSSIKGLQFNFLRNYQFDCGFVDLYTHRTLIITLKDEIKNIYIKKNPTGQEKNKHGFVIIKSRCMGKKIKN